MKASSLGVTPYHSSRLASVAVVVTLHVVALAALLQYQPIRTALRQSAPIMVSLITPPEIVKKPQVPPKPLPVKPQRPDVRPPPLAPLTTAAPEAPAQALTAPAPPPDLPPVPALSPIEAAPTLPPAVTAQAPPVVPPSFDAAYLDNPAPAYPPLSRRMGEQGKVVLRVLVSAKGLAEKVEVRSSSGSGRLDAVALDTVKRWRFVPARQSNEPVAAWVLVPISFTLKG